MTWMLEERRTRRSACLDLALQFQIEVTREKGRLEALVLADRDGLVLASSGNAALCEELGAVAPMMKSHRDFASARLQHSEVAVRSVHLHGEELFLAGVGGNVARDALLAHSERGIQRILTAN